MRVNPIHWTHPLLCTPRSWNADLNAGRTEEEERLQGVVLPAAGDLGSETMSVGPSIEQGRSAKDTQSVRSFKLALGGRPCASSLATGVRRAERGMTQSVRLRLTTLHSVCSRL